MLIITIATQYNDTGLTPSTSYQHQIEAFNDAGSTTSVRIADNTSPGIPSGNISIQITGITATSVSLAWTAPSQPNGVIQHYIVICKKSSQDPGTSYNMALKTSAIIPNLNSFADYLFMVNACTSAGCLSSKLVNAETSQALPTGQSHPSITAISSTALYVTWTPPDHPNG